MTCSDAILHMPFMLGDVYLIEFGKRYFMV